MKIKCLIVDDEPLAIDIIESYIEKIDRLEIVAKCNNAVKAFEILQQKSVDLVFLDIQMPKLTGIDFLKAIKNPPKIIFTTAYRDFAVEGFELDVLDYLVKPISFDRFLKAVNKYYQYASPPKQPIAEKKQTDDAIYVKENKKVVKIHIADIYYIESIKDYVKIHTKAKSVVTKQQISYFEDNLPEGKFLRIHRSFIIAIDKIEAFSSNAVDIDIEELPIGRSYKNSVLQVLNPKDSVF